MDKEKIMDAMTRIDPALVEEADRGALRPRKRWARPALIAACLCLLLAGTVLAVESGILVEFIRGDEGLGNLSELVGYEIAGHYEITTAKRIPLENFSQTVRGVSEELGTEKLRGFYGFTTWEAAEDFIGMDVMDNPVLDSARMGLIAVGEDEGRGPDGVRANVIVSLQNSSETGELICARMEGNYNVRNLANVIVTATLVTDRNAYEKGGGIIFTYDAEQLENLDAQEYVTASGATATIVRDANPTPSYEKEDTAFESPSYDDDLGFEEVRYTAFLPVGNAVVMLETRTNAFVDGEESLTLLQEILDSFQ